MVFQINGQYINANSYGDAKKIYDASHAKPVVPVPVAVAPVTTRFTTVVTPADNFGGRSLVRFGVGEVLTLSFATAPATQTAASFGGLTWVLVKGTGTLVNNPGNSGIATFTCDDVAGYITLELRTCAVPAIAKLTKSFQVVAPTDARMARVPGSGTFHRQNTGSAGFHGEIFFEPRDVSFRNLEFREGSAPFEATGSMNTILSAGKNDIAGIRHPLMGTWLPLLGGNIATGSKVNGFDTVRTMTTSPPYAAGTFTWNIPWLYRVIGRGRDHQFTIAAHSESIDATGQTTISKKGTAVTHNAADLSSDP